MSLKDKIVAMVREAPVTAYDVSVELGVSQKVARTHLSYYAGAGLLREVAQVPTTADATTTCALYDLAIAQAPKAVRPKRETRISQIVRALESGASTCTEVAKAIGVRPPVVGPNLTYLAGMGVIRKARNRPDARGRPAVAEWEFVRSASA